MKKEQDSKIGNPYQSPENLTLTEKEITRTHKTFKKLNEGYIKTGAEGAAFVSVILENFSKENAVAAIFAAADGNNNVVNEVLGHQGLELLKQLHKRKETSSLPVNQDGKTLLDRLHRRRFLLQIGELISSTVCLASLGTAIASNIVDKNKKHLLIDVDKNPFLDSNIPEKILAASIVTNATLLYLNERLKKPFECAIASEKANEYFARRFTQQSQALPDFE